MWWRRVKALIVKEYYQIVRDVSSILISVVLPLILLFIYGFGVSLDIKHLRIGLVMEGTAPDAQSFAKSLTNSPYFDVQIDQDRNSFDRMIVDGSIRGIVVIPSYFSAFRERPPNQAPIQVIADASDPNTASFVQNYVAAAFANWLVQEQISSRWQGLPLVNLQPRYWFNEQLDSRYFLLPGSLAIIMTLIGTLLTALVISREWERGTMESLMATPVRMSEVLIAKLISYFILGMVSFILSASLTILVFQVPFRGSFLLLLFTASIFLFTALGLGLYISTISKNQFVASQAALITAFLPAFMLSGFVFEISSMPWPIRAISQIIPARYFVSCLQTLFLAGNVWALVLRNILIMGLLGMICYFLTIFKTAKRLD
ncbi:MAG TPA: ABC transporter permease [Chlamydiales bacterium]|nr:ABC transporter permease [Chlamydiales bacterium]